MLDYAKATEEKLALGHSVWT